MSPDELLQLAARFRGGLYVHFYSGEHVRGLCSSLTPMLRNDEGLVCLEVGSIPELLADMFRPASFPALASIGGGLFLDCVYATQDVAELVNYTREDRR